MKQIIKKLALPKPLKRNDGFPRSTSWNPKLPASATSNRPPRKMWPHKEGSAVIFIDNRFDGAARSGRVKWFNPARTVDVSCLVTAGKPHFNITDGDGTGSNLISGDMIFPYSKKGWIDCLLKFAAIYKRHGESHLEESAKHIADAAKCKTLSKQITKQASRTAN